MTTYYNEIDPDAAEWLRELIRLGEIPPGDVDERSIEDVKPEDLAGYAQCHFFAGIGGWSLALRFAGWPDDRPVWTASCPCQPFSAAGKRRGTTDERHLWPAFWWLAAQCRPSKIFGEQVASKAGRSWLAGVRADLETLGYAVGAADLCAAGVGAPQIRQRLFWMGDTEQPGLEGHAGDETDRDEPGRQPTAAARPATEAGGDCGLSDAGRARGLGRESAERPDGAESPERHEGSNHNQSCGSFSGIWSDAVWIDCADGKARRIEPGIEPLVNGLPRGVVPRGHIGVAEAKNSGEARAMRLKGYGNAIVPLLATVFIEETDQSSRGIQETIALDLFDLLY